MSDHDQHVADLLNRTDEQYQETQQEQQEFLEAVSEEEGAELLETQTELVSGYTVDLKAKMDGKLTDKLGHIDARLERLDSEEARAYEVSEAADDASRLLADIVDDPEYSKSLFYEVYESEGLGALGTMIERAFEALKQERKRRRGTVDGFRGER